jgi:NAD(P)H-flavin reductase
MHETAERAPMVPRACRIVDRRVEVDDVVTLGLEPLDGVPLRFAPGQFNMLYVFGVGEVPISISGDPSSDGPLRHTIRAVGAVTRALCAAEPGDVIGLRGPFGTDWDLPSAEGADVVVIGGGIGVAPLRPAILALLADRPRYGQVSILLGARSPDLLLFADELRAAADGAGLHVATIVDHADPYWAGPVGVVSELIQAAPFDPPRAVSLLCGPEVMLRFSAAALTDRGVAPERIRVSLERNMQCALGYCGHCQLGPDFLCKDGPVVPYARVRDLLALREV